MKLNLLFSILFLMLTGSCNEAKKMNHESKNSDIVSISLIQKSDTGTKELTLYKNHYTMNINDENYRYDLKSEKWTELRNILNSLDIDNLSNYFSDEPEGRFVDKSLVSQIIIENKNGKNSSQEITPERIPKELNELYDFLLSFFPLQ